MNGPVYRVILRARRNGFWQLHFLNGKTKLFKIEFYKQSAAEYTAAKIVDELLRNRQEFEAEVQDEDGGRLPIDLVRVAQRRKVRNS